MNCPECGADIQKDALFCKHCGTQLPDVSAEMSTVDPPTVPVEGNSPLVKCIDCQHLCAINEEPLPEAQREQLRSGSPDSFTWLTCSKALESFEPIQPQVFEQVLNERNCSGYTLYRPSPATGQTMKREARQMPTSHKVTIISVVLLLIAAATTGVIMVLS